MLKKITHYIGRLELPYYVGFSILGMMVYGLFVNTVLYRIGIKDPLSIRYVWPVCLLLLPLGVKSVQEIKSLKEINLYSLLLTILCILNPFISIAGAFRLNVTNDNRLSVLSLLIIIIIFILTFWKRNLQNSRYVISIFSAALSLVFLNSLRSNLLMGWDIHQEFLVFRLTSSHNFWSMSFYRDAYNACLSITILPTIIRNLTGTDHLTVFRFIFPIILSFVPVSVYYTSTRILSKRFAYAAAFSFLLQSQFFNQLPALLRQGIGFIFFALLIDLIVRRDVSLNKRKLFFLLFSVGMVISHYSTTYMAVAIFCIAKIFMLLSKIIFKDKKKTVLSFPILIALLLMVFVWNSLITNTSKGLVNTIHQIASNIDKSFTLENKSSMVKNALYITTSNSSLVQSYVDEKMTGVEKPELYSKYAVKPRSIDIIKTTKYSKFLSSYFHIMVPWVFRVFIIVGYFFYLYKTIKGKEEFDVISAATAMLILIVASIVVPYISVNYNLERILQQMMVLLSSFCILGIISSIRFKSSILSSFFISVILISYPLQSTGYIDRILLNTKNITFDNEGEQYLAYFSKSAEVQSLLWIDQNVPEDSVINMDRYSQLRLKAYTDKVYNFNKNIRQDLTPPALFNGSYTLAGNAATTNDIVFTAFNNQIIKYTFPFNFLDDKKDLIYSNAVSKIYR